MKKTFLTFMSYVFAFTLGIYASSQFRFNHPIELHRWVITSLFFLFFLTIKKDDTN